MPSRRHRDLEKSNLDKHGKEELHPGGPGVVTEVGQGHIDQAF
jgi:hypothetical protein